jgi:hypothetical protein
MTQEARGLVRGLGVFYGGAYTALISYVLGVELEKARELASEVVNVGLGLYLGYGHLRLDPALPAYLLREMDPAEEEELRSRWAEGMKGLTHFLYGKLSEDAELA